MSNRDHDPDRGFWLMVLAFLAVVLCQLPRLMEWLRSL